MWILRVIVILLMFFIMHSRKRDSNAIYRTVFQFTTFNKLRTKVHFGHKVEHKLS